MNFRNLAVNHEGLFGASADLLLAVGGFLKALGLSVCLVVVILSTSSFANAIEKAFTELSDWLIALHARDLRVCLFNHAPGIPPRDSAAD